MDGQLPSEVFREHFWVSPFPEDDIPALTRSIGHEAVVFGSDWPHAEGLHNPVDFVHDLKGFSDDEIKLIMRENGLGLVVPRKTVAA